MIFRACTLPHRAPLIPRPLPARRPLGAVIAQSAGAVVVAALLVGCERGGSAPATQGSAQGGAQGGAQGSSTRESRPWLIATSSYPLYDLARALTHNLRGVEVSLATPPGEDPAAWAPSDEALALYQRADLVALNGAAFEAWEALVSLPPSRTLHTAQGFEGSWLRYEAQGTHSHGPQGAHSHEGVDGHTWLDPLLAAEQAAALCAAIERARPALAAQARSNLAALTEALKGLHAEWEALAPALRQRRLIAAHPAYNYLKRRHALPLVSLDLDPEEAPGAAQRVAVEALLEGVEGEALLWWESHPSAAALEGLRGLRLRHVVVSPVESAPAEGGYLDAARANVQRLRDALALPSPSPAVPPSPPSPPPGAPPAPSTGAK